MVESGRPLIPSLIPAHMLHAQDAKEQLYSKVLNADNILDIAAHMLCTGICFPVSVTADIAALAGRVTGDCRLHAGIGWHPAPGLPHSL